MFDFLKIKTPEEVMWASLKNLSLKKFKKSLNMGANPNTLNTQGQLFVVELLKTAVQSSYWFNSAQDMLNLLIEHPTMDWTKTDGQGFGVASALVAFCPHRIPFHRPKAWRKMHFPLLRRPKDIEEPTITSINTLGYSGNISAIYTDNLVLLNPWKKDKVEGQLFFNFIALKELLLSEAPLDWTQPMMQKTTKGNGYKVYLGDMGLARAFQMANWDLWDAVLVQPIDNICAVHPKEGYSLLFKAVRNASLKAIDALLKRGLQGHEGNIRADNPASWPRAYRDEIQVLFDRHRLDQTLPPPSLATEKKVHRL